jgi:hypothetical protein
MNRTKIDVFDCASEFDLKRIETIMSRSEKFSEEIIKSPFLLIIWKENSRVHIGYFEKSSKDDTDKSQNILSSFEIIRTEIVEFPYLKLTWIEGSTL